MDKYIVVIYDVYKFDTLSCNGKVQKSEKWERVKFSKENLEYNDGITYEENVRNFVDDCIENSCVCIGESYIPLHNIHGWYFDNKSMGKPEVITEVIAEVIAESVKPIESVKKPCKSNRKTSRSKKKGSKWDKSLNKWVKTKKPVPATSDLPYEVKEVKE